MACKSDERHLEKLQEQEKKRRRSERKNSLRLERDQHLAAINRQILFELKTDREKNKGLLKETIISRGVETKLKIWDSFRSSLARIN